MIRPSLALLTPALFLVPTLLFVTPSYGEPPSDTVCAEAERLQEQILQLRQEVRVGEVEIRRLRQEIERLGRGSTVVQETPSVSPETLGEAVEALPVEASDELTVEASDIEESDLEDIEGIDIQEGEIGAPVAPPVEAPSPTSSDTASAPFDLYDSAYADFHQKRYPEALEKFQRYLTTYGETDLADNAQFWIGAVHKALDDPEAALEAFTKTVAEYPEGNKVPDALLEAGECLVQLGEIDGAKETWQELIRRHPNSAASTVAAEQLENLP